MRFWQSLQDQEGAPVRAISVLVAGLFAAAAIATPEQMEAFHTALRLKESFRLYKAECMSCHTKPPEHNAFGKDVKSALKAGGKDLVTLELIRSLDAKDSDGDGWPNGEEIKQDFLPGDPKSHPAGMPPKATNHEGMMGANMDNPSGKEQSLLDRYVPKHSFHPLIIHFPIALFLFGAGLEVFGWRRKDPTMRKAGWWALLFGALSTAIAIPTGLMVFLRSGFQWQGTALIHSILAVTATLLMAATVIWRRKGAHESLSYFTLLGLAAIAVGAAGHFGALLVYGP
jgi:uncharacterized membrane protein